MGKVLALILAGGAGDRLSVLSQERAKPAVPFGGKFRIIDFALSNCVNSGITKIGILTQYLPRSLMDHIGNGRPWNLDRTDGGVFVLQPFTGRRGSEWYKGTADAVYQNLFFIREDRAPHVLVLAGDHVYNMDYQEMLEFHLQKEAEATVGVVEVPAEEASRYGILSLNSDSMVASWEEKPAQPKGRLASMGIYLFNKAVLLRYLAHDAKKSGSHDFGHDILPAMIAEGRVYGYRFEGYWRDVGTVDAYWQANMDLIVDLPQFNLYDPERPVLTREQPRPPVKAGPRAQVTRSLVSPGCIINGEVRNSVLSPGVYVEEGAHVHDSIIFDDTVLDRDVVVRYSILDKGVQVGAGACIGYGGDYTPSQEEPERLHSGITLVGKRACIPPNIIIGRNCKVYPEVEEGDFPSQFISSGVTVRGSWLP